MRGAHELKNYNDDVHKQFVL